MDSDNDRPKSIGPPHSAQERWERGAFSMWVEEALPDVDRLMKAKKIPYDDADDVKSEAMELAWRRSVEAQMEPTRHSVRRLLFDRIKWALKNRKKKRKKAWRSGRVYVELDPQELRAIDDPHLLAEGSDFEAAVAAFLELQGGQQETVVELRRAGYELKEIASLIRTKDSTAKEYLDRARTRLRRSMRDAGYDVPEK